jgi:CheY-like chemotaxis protein/HPt (histidine-containing phosphotransfer) domain-containing protein
MLHFAVHDTGIGIAPDKQRLIFEAFSQADNSNTREFGGTGLGLAICARLVEAMQGRIWVESVLGQGSSFHFNACLKRPDMNHNAPAGEADKTPINVVPQSATPKSLRILLAEDNPVNQRLAARMLEKEGHEVAVASNGKEAFAMWLDSPFDLILMDMQMPEMDGYTATRRLRKDGYKGPIVALTAHAMEGDRAQCIAAGCDDYLTKPIDRPMLLATVERYAQASMGRGDTLLAPSQFVRTSDAPLVSELADDPDVADIVDGFARAARARADALLKALGDDDAPTMQRLVHQLKGAAGGYGFPSITEQARNVEAAFAGGDTERLAAEVQALSRLCYRAGRAAVAGHAESLRESAA